MGRQHIRDGVLTVKQQKTGVDAGIPVHPHLQAVLDATASEHLTFLVTATGKPYGGNAFSEQFRNWCDAAGLPKRCKPHGLRKAACRRLAEAGCAANEIMAHQRTHDAERTCPLHRRRGSGAARSQCVGEGGHPMTRREFITLLGGAAAVRGHRAPRRQRSKRLIGLLGGASPASSDSRKSKLGSVACANLGMWKDKTTRSWPSGPSV